MLLSRGVFGQAERHTGCCPERACNKCPLTLSLLPCLGLRSVQRLRRLCHGNIRLTSPFLSRSKSKSVLERERSILVAVKMKDWSASPFLSDNLLPPSGHILPLRLEIQFSLPVVEGRPSCPQKSQLHPHSDSHGRRPLNSDKSETERARFSAPCWAHLVPTRNEKGLNRWHSQRHCLVCSASFWSRPDTKHS